MEWIGVAVDGGSLMAGHGYKLSLMHFSQCELKYLGNLELELAN